MQAARCRSDRPPNRQDAIFAERCGDARQDPIVMARKEQQKRLAGESRAVAMNTLWSA